MTPASAAKWISYRYSIDNLSCPISTEDLLQEYELANLRGRKSVTGPMQDLMRDQYCCGARHQKRKIRSLSLKREPIYYIQHKPERSRQVFPDIRELPEREQFVLRQYYWEQRTLRSIGEDLGVNESRVHQIRTAAILKLRAALENPWIKK